MVICCNRWSGEKEPSSRFAGLLTGMNETSALVVAAPQNFTPSVILQKVVNVANVGAVPSGQDHLHRWAHGHAVRGTVSTQGPPWR